MNHEANSFRDGHITRPSAARAEDQVMLSIAIDALDFLIGDLRTMQGLIEHDGKVPACLTQAVERKVLKLLDSISPEIRYAIAEFKRYRAAGKIGAPR